ncbi:MAG: hypothetical protein ACM3O3_05265 [Syntrophothermus sp.]
MKTYGNNLSNHILGTKVTKSKSAVLDGVQNVIFTIAGGRVLITHLEGEICDAAVDTEGATVKFVFNPTVGSDSDMCATADLNAAPIGTTFSISGVPGDALVFDTGITPGMVRTGLSLAEGTIDVLSGGDNDAGGAKAKFELWYIPLDEGAVVS